MEVSQSDIDEIERLLREEKNDALILKIEVSQSEIDELDRLLREERKKNNALISKLLLLKDVVEKKEYEYLTMSDKERLNAQIAKKGIS